MKKRYTKQSRRTVPARRTPQKRHTARMSLGGMVRLSYGMTFGLTLFSFLAAYLFVVNDAAVKGTEIRALENRIAVLEASAEAYALEEAALRSLAHPGESDTLESVAAQDIRIIAVAGDATPSQSDGEQNIIVAVAE